MNERYEKHKKKLKIIGDNFFDYMFANEEEREKIIKKVVDKLE